MSERVPASRRSAEQLPKITIVTPSFNQAAFLETTMRSVLDQPGVRLDFIVQDAGSTDGSADIVRRHAARLKHAESAPDAGQADAVVRGFTHADCGPDDVMAYLNSDDVLMPGALRFVAGYFARHPAVDVVYGHRVIIFGFLPQNLKTRGGGRGFQCAVRRGTRGSRSRCWPRRRRRRRRPIAACRRCS